MVPSTPAPRAARKLTIALVSAVTLSAELCFTRLFSVLFFHHLVFLILSTALFGFGLSGVILALSRRLRAANVDAIASAASFGLAACLVLALAVITGVQTEPSRIFAEPAAIVPLVLHYLALVLPFLMAGLVIGSYLTRLSSEAPALYGWDLAAAGLAAGLTAILIAWLSPQTLLIGGAAVALMAGGIAAPPERRRLRTGALAAGALGVLSAPFLAGLFELPLRHAFFQKHGNFYQAPTRPIEHSAWSVLARIDVLDVSPRKLIYIDGGANVSLMVPFDGRTERLNPIVDWRSLAYVWFDRPRVLIIGPGGGEDVLSALSHRPSSITAVELDPVICNLMTGRYAQFTGNIYRHPLVQLVNDEGRSFVRRSRETYDLIVQIHNISPTALAAGALNLSESYLLTVEAFGEYLDHLTDDGVLCINRWGSTRLASLASETLLRRGVKSPENHAIVTFEPGAGGETFYLKKTPFHADQVEALEAASSKVRILYAPQPRFQTAANPIYRLMNAELRGPTLANTSLDLTAPTDDRPFFDHFSRFARFDSDPELLPQSSAKVVRFFNTGDLILLVTLGEGALLAGLFLLLPMLILGRSGASWSTRLTTAIYFGALGAGFIFVEICLIQKLILYLGHPVYSIALVISTLLCAMGAGSHVAGFLERRFESPRIPLAGIASLSAAGLILAEWLVLSPILQATLGGAFSARIAVAIAVVAPLGFVLGMPFPLGLRWLERAGPGLLPWAWALNGYFTVIGSALTVAIALSWGFGWVLALATLLYTAAALAVSVKGMP